MTHLSISLKNICKEREKGEQMRFLHLPIYLSWDFRCLFFHFSIKCSHSLTLLLHKKHSIVLLFNFNFFPQKTTCIHTTAVPQKISWFDTWYYYLLIPFPFFHWKNILIFNFFLIPLCFLEVTLCVRNPVFSMKRKEYLSTST